MNKKVTLKMTALLLILTLAFSVVGCSKISIPVNNGIDIFTEDHSITTKPSEEQIESSMEDETEPSMEDETEPSIEETTDGTTTEPVTQAPTTEAPTTEPPTTEVPTTQAPTQKPTQAPTTQAPTQKPTQAPTTQPPTTQPPTTSSEVVIGDLIFTEHSYSNIRSYTAIPTEEEIGEVRRVLATLITKNMSDVERIKVVHDWLVKHTTYEETYYGRPNNRNFIYNLMFNKAAVCQGYAVTFYVMMTELGIPCTIVGGTANGGGHA